MEKRYTVLDQDASHSGSVRLAICEDYAALEAVMNFKALEEAAAFQNLPSPSSFGFQHFRKQLPVTKIYPVAILEDLEIDHRQRRRGIGRMAVRAFRAVAEEHGSLLGLLQIGTVGTGDVDYESALEWRKRFYESEGWRCFEAPPIRGLVLVWMYHLLPPLTPTERALQSCLVEETSRENPFGPIPFHEESA